MVQSGDVLAGKYRVERILGKGGMGYVVAAIHTQLEERVAIKLLMPELCVQEEAVERFLREARAAVRIRNEHVARVLDVGLLEDGSPYMVMEYLEGQDLSAELDRRMQLPVHEAVEYVLQACEAIAEAHARGIVHRDLKPANLFLTRRPDGAPLVKVLDFGISKAVIADVAEPSASLTATQSLLGSPHYMSPEQVRKPKSVDARTDIWSLGVILYELLTGSLPFSAENAMSVLAAVVSDPTPRLRQTRADVPEGLENVVSRCLSKDAAQRFGDVEEFAQALLAFAPPHAVASINRISGVLRGVSDTQSLAPPATPRAAKPVVSRGSEEATLVSQPDGGDVSTDPTLRADFARVSTERTSRPSETASQWEHSKEASDRKSRFPALFLIGVGLLGALATGAYALSRLQAPSAAPDILDAHSAAGDFNGNHAASAAPSTALPAMNPAASAAAQVPLTNDAGTFEQGSTASEADGATPSVEPAIPRRSYGARTKPAASSTKSTEQPPRATPPGEKQAIDPLDGRH